MKVQSKRKHLINEFIEYAKGKNGAIVKYDNGFLVVSKTIPDFAIKSDYTFGNYKGVHITKPTTPKSKAKLPQELLDAKAKLSQELLDAFESTLKKQQEQEQERYKELEKLKALPLEKILKELERDMKDYGKSKFINQYQGYDRALLAGAIEIAFKEKVNLKGDIVVVTLGGSKFMARLIAKLVLKTTKMSKKDLTDEQKKDFAEELSKHVKYSRLTPQVEKRLKISQEATKEIEEGKTDRAKEAIKMMKEYLGGKVPFNEIEEAVNANKVKESIKKDMSEAQAWLALLTAWCDTKERKYTSSKQIIDAVNNNSRGKELGETLEIFDINNIKNGTVGYTNKIEGRELSTHEITAFFDVLLTLYSQGVIKKGFILVDGRPSKRSLKEAQKTNYPLITSKTIAKLTNVDNRFFVHNVKEALKNFTQIEWQIAGTLKKIDKRAVFKIKPVVFKRSLEIEGAGKFYLYEIAKDLFEYEVKQHERTFAILDKGAFSSIAISGKPPKTQHDASQLLIALYKQAGSRRSGDRRTFISYDFFGDREAQHKSRSKQRVIRALESLKEEGDIENYEDKKGKFLVNLGG